MQSIEGPMSQSQWTTDFCPTLSRRLSGHLQRRKVSQSISAMELNYSTFFPSFHLPKPFNGLTAGTTPADSISIGGPFPPPAALLFCSFQRRSDNQGDESGGESEEDAVMMCAAQSAADNVAICALNWVFRVARLPPFHSLRRLCW